MILLLISCAPQYGYSNLQGLDVFQQARRNTVDVLLVVDDSGSMAEEQDKLAASFQRFIDAFQGVDVDWRIAVTTTDVADQDRAGHLRGGEDEVVLTRADGVELDRVAWDLSWPVPPGAALQLDPASHSPTANDAPTTADGAPAWCAASTPMADGDRGSPGQPNPWCADGSAWERWPEGTGAGAPTRTPQVGDLVISELMIDPSASPDAVGEWVELTSRVLDFLDLSGAVVSDLGRNTFTVPEGTLIPPGGHLLLTRGPDASGGLAPAVAVDAGLTLADPVTVLTPDLPDQAELFAELVAVGTRGAGFEMGLEAARLALSEPLRSGANAGFLRDDARLALVFVTDEDDYSPLAPADYLLAYALGKGDAAFRTAGLLTVSAVAGVTPPPYDGALSCESQDGAAEYGSRYLALVERSAGTAQDICQDDFATLAGQVGLVVSGLTTVLPLSRPADPDTLVVRVYDSQDDDSLLYEAVQGADYVFLSSDNAISFLAHAVPPSLSWITVEYELLAEGQAL